MKNRLLGIVALTALALAAACSGGGGGSVTPNAAIAPPQAQPNAKSTFTMKIPLSLGNIEIPSTAGRASGKSARRKPAFVSGNSDGGITILFDGQIVVNDLTFSPNGGTATPAPAATSLPNGGSFSYTSQIVTEGNQVYAEVSGNYNTIPGTHTVGVVQTNGQCDNTDGGPCNSDSNGYVLAEGQTSISLQPGGNNATNLTLAGVMASAYLCSDANCDGQMNYGPNGYLITVFVADESGDAIPQQSVNGSILPFDNGSYQVVETDGQGIVTINPYGPWNTPGDAAEQPGAAAAAQGPYGQNINITCNKVGTATVAVQLLSTDPSQGSVTGFPYTSTNYPQPGSYIGAVGADEDYGNELSVNCSVSGSITID